MPTVILFRLDEYAGQAISATLWSKPLVGAPSVAYTGTTTESGTEAGLFSLTIAATVAAGFYAIRAKLDGDAIAYDTDVYCDGTADTFVEQNYHNRLDSSISSRLAADDYKTPLDATQTTAAAASALTAYDPPTRAEATADKAAILAAVNDIAIGDITIEDVTVSSFSSAAIQQLASTRQININVPTLLGRTLTDPLVQGDSYTSALGSAIEFSRADFVDIPDGSTAALHAMMIDCNQPATFVIDGEQASIPVQTGTKVVRFEPTSAQTAQWKPGKYEFHVEITFASGETRSFIGPRTYLWVV